MGLCSICGQHSDNLTPLPANRRGAEVTYACEPCSTYSYAPPNYQDILTKLKHRIAIGKPPALRNKEAQWLVDYLEGHGS